MFIWSLCFSLLSACIAWSQNKNHCAVNERITDCVTPCSSCQYAFNGCPIKVACKTGCDCIPGYYRNHEGWCIPKDQCPKAQCRSDEVYNNCGTSCPVTCENLNNPPQACAAVCVPGCFCKSGLVRNFDGNCIPPQFCNNVVCKKDEQYYECIPDCGNTCDTFGIRDLKCAAICKPGCFCKPGLVADANGNCIFPGNCPNQKCEPGEVYDECGTPCPERNCADWNEDIFCTRPCIKGCFCRNGLVRSGTGKCIVPAQCQLEKCNENEVPSDCVIPCNDCEIKGACGIFVCKKGCECKPGYFRDKKGRCIPEHQCPGSPAQCPENEVFSDCVVPCNDCHTRGKCQFIVCNKGCDCIKGYYRTAYGSCVPENQCPNEICGENEEYSDCGTACQPTCYNYDKEVPCILICKMGCFCKKDFVRYPDENGICIPISMCKTVPNVVCTLKPEIGPCTAVIPQFYYDSAAGQCKLFSYGGCGGNGNRFGTVEECLSACSVPNNICRLKPETGPCAAAIPQFYYDSKTGQCKLFSYGGCEGNGNRFGTVEECLSACSGVCGSNEEYQECGTACPKTCNNRNANVMCTLQCVSGCFCKDGLIRNDFNECIPPELCPPGACKDDEQYYECIPDCGNTCDTYGIPDLTCTAICNSGCFCKPGLVADADGKCILPQNCPSLPNDVCSLKPETGPCKANMPKFYYDPRSRQCKPFIYGGCKGNGNRFDTIEECLYTCSDSCPPNEVPTDCAPRPTCRTCANRKKPPTAAECETFACQKGCECREGYYRNAKGFCIPENECPEKCGKNEEYSKCGTACPKNCANWDWDSFCLQYCVEGCFCKDGLVRSGSGKCILPRRCPREKCTDTEVRSNCVKPCDDCGNKNKCDIFTCKKGCQCKEGYYRNEKGICIPEEQCPDTCPQNEVPTDCAPRPTCRTCANRGKPPTAEECETFACQKGCECREGYVRNSDGICIPEEDCPGECGDNEEYNECGTACEKTCDNIAVDIGCTEKCVKGCFCKDGFIRSKDKKCILPKECPNPCGRNEELVCGTDCPISCSNLNTWTLEGACFDTCKCLCKKGLVKSDGGKCIPPGKCPRSVCPRNEIPTDCVLPCESCAHRGENCDQYDCQLGCKCRKKYYRLNGECISKKKCPGKGGGRRRLSLKNSEQSQ